jgi:hypothetical protein
MWGNYLSGSRSGFFYGLAMVGAGIGLTITSAVLSLEFGWAVSFVFYGLIFVGLIRIVLSVPALLFGDGDSGRPAHYRRVLAQPYVAPPNEMPLGRCWMCGGKVRRGNLICLHCGAAQPPTAPGESETSRLSGYDPNAGDLVTFLPSDGPESSSPYPSAPYPAVNPGGYPTPERAGQWNARMPPPAPAPGSVWRPEPESDGDWDEAPAKRPRWRLR